MRTPTTQYAKSGDASIAYQSFGKGPPNLVVVNGPASHLELLWEEPATVQSLEKLGSFARVVLFDRQGTGLSDPLTESPTLEQQMDDLTAVLDAAGIEQTALFGASDLGLCALYAATHPDRVTALVLSGVSSSGGIPLTPELREQLVDAVEHHWGEGTLVQLYAPSRVGDRKFVEWWGRMQRSAASPRVARQLIELRAESDLRAVLPTIRVPTFVTHVSGDRIVPIEEGREVARLIPGARFHEYPGEDAYAWIDFPALEEIEEFLTGRRTAPEPDRVLATVMFTDIVNSTGHAAELGDRRWRDLLDRHDELIREQLSRWRGSEVKTIGDSFLATFDGPARAVRCAGEITETLPELGLDVRIGMHTGECELLPGDVAGIAVNIAARIEATAQPREVLVSSTVKDLVVGSGLRFRDRGEHELKGVPERWRLYALER